MVLSGEIVAGRYMVLASEERVEVKKEEGRYPIFLVGRLVYIRVKLSSLVTPKGEKTVY